MSSEGGYFAKLEATLKRSALALQRARIPFLLGGSLAVWARGGPESCHDLDLMLRRGDAEAALAALERAGMRAERPAEEWLLKAHDGEVQVDLIFGPRGITIDDGVFARSSRVRAFGVELDAMALENVLATKLLALEDHYLDLEPPLQMARAVREQVDWDEVRRMTEHSPYAKAFLALTDELGVSRPARAAAVAAHRPRVRLAQ